MKIRFVVNAAPRGKGRPRFSVRGGYVATYTDKETADYEKLVKTEYRAQVGRRGFSGDDMLDMRIIAYYEIPKSATKQQKREMEFGIIRPTKTPDWDNVGKVICDSLNGIAFHDDKQIVDAQVRKFYSRQPRIEITILQVNPLKEAQVK